MKRVISILFFSCIVKSGFAQLNFDPDKLKQLLDKTTNDTLRLTYTDSLIFNYSEINQDSALLYADQEIKLAQKLDLKLNVAMAMHNKAYALINLGNFPMALQVLLSAIKIANDEHSDKSYSARSFPSLIGVYANQSTAQNVRKQVLSWLMFDMGILYENVNNPDKAMHYYRQTLQLANETGNKDILGLANMNLGRIYLFIDKKDSALYFEKAAYTLADQWKVKSFKGSLLLNVGRVYLALDDKQKAVPFLYGAIVTSLEQNYYRGAIAASLLLANMHLKENKLDSAFYYVAKAHQLATEVNAPDLLLRTDIVLADYYKQAYNADSIVKYQGQIIKIRDSLFNSKQARQFQDIDSYETQHQQELATAKKDYRYKLQKYLLIGGLAAFAIFIAFLWRNILNRKRSYHLLELQKQETDFQKSKVESALEELKTTQSQLIQAEKMASLGELTAGIAHEIQNPLNFINNFSEVNTELIDEMKEELRSGKTDGAIGVAEDIKQNNEKITYHGKRADSIVKGMLQHSRDSSGQKEATNINALADECLRLSFHGMRAKDKSFNAKTETNFDDTLPMLNIVSQDIGRVLLNLLTNAFYAVTQKKKLLRDAYAPVVSVTTKRVGDHVEIRIRDNGNGIPPKVLDKIYQPFFTTKPTGEGTGLGLSMSYDIIKKGHLGELKVKTKEGEYAEFIIILPL